MHACILYTYIRTTEIHNYIHMTHFKLIKMESICIISDDFHRLFREDLLLASLFRNFLLAERVMRSYNCTPVTCPKLPSTYHHPMW